MAGAALADHRSCPRCAAQPSLHPLPLPWPPALLLLELALHASSMLQAFCAEHPGLLEAVAGAAQGMAPATAAQLLRMLQAELPPALNDVAPGGDCVLVAITPGLLPLLGECRRVAAAGWLHVLAGAQRIPFSARRAQAAGGSVCCRSLCFHALHALGLPLSVCLNRSLPARLLCAERAGDCCEASLRGGELALAAAAARAALSLLSCLRFGCGESAAPYAAVAVRCKQALKAAYDAGAIIAQEVGRG